MQTSKSKQTHHHIEDSASEAHEHAHKPAKAMFKLNNWHIAGITALILLAVLYYFRGMFIVARVNGKFVTRNEYVAEMQRLAGKRALDNVITLELVKQEAKKKNVSISNKEVDSEMQKVRNGLTAQGQTLEQALKDNGMTMADLKQQVKVQLMIKKLLADKIKVSDKEVAAFAEENKETAPQSKETIRQQLESQKLNEAFGPWISDLKAKSKINTFIGV